MLLAGVPDFPTGSTTTSRSVNWPDTPSPYESARPAVRSAAVTMASCRNAGSWASGPDAKEPSDYWLSYLPPDTSLVELVALAKARWRIEDDCRGLKTGLGLDQLAHPRPGGRPAVSRRSRRPQGRDPRLGRCRGMPPR
jgi:hypothetical protein